MAALVEFLKQNGINGVNKLGVKYARHSVYPNLVLFKYDQLDSPMSNKVVQECRGIILDENEGWRIVAYPFKKFFNYGESNAAKIDWKGPVRVFEKVDGSLMTLYHYKGEWQVATSGKPDAMGATSQHVLHRVADFMKSTPDFEVENLEVGDESGLTYDEDGDEPATGAAASAATVNTNKGVAPPIRVVLPRVARLSFKEEFWRVWNLLGYKLPEDTTKCFFFELVSAANRVVVVYENDNILCHGVRDMTSLNEEEPETYAQKYGWAIPTWQTLPNIHAVIEAAKKLNPIKAEGFVVRDCKFDRIKIKSPLYVQVALLRTKDPDGINFQRLVHLIQQNEGDEFLTYFPQFKPSLDDILARLEAMIDLIDENWAKLKSFATNDKEFAKEAKKAEGWLQGALFVKKKNPDRPTRKMVLAMSGLATVLKTIAPKSVPKPATATNTTTDSTSDQK